MVNCQACCDFYIPRRHVLVVLLAMGMCIAHVMRVCFSVTAITILDSSVHSKLDGDVDEVDLPRVEWNTHQVGVLHSMFYVGFLVSQLPFGYLATILPANRLFGASILVSSCIQICFPIVVDNSTYIVTAVMRCLQGLAEGAIFPAGYALLRHWTILPERGRSGALVVGATYLGPVLGLPLAGYLTHYEGWQYVYYLTGGIGVVWLIIWMFLSYDTPENHPSISPDELKTILGHQGDSAFLYADVPVPWRDILTSMPVISLCVCNFSRNFVFHMLLTNGTVYINSFNQFTVAEIGVLSALPHILMAGVAMLSGPVADLTIAYNILNITQTRKLFTCTGFGMEAVCFLFLYFTTNGLNAVIFLTIGVGISGFTVSGWQINHLDLAPRYASILVALTSEVGAVASVVMPVIVGYMTSHQWVSEWQNVFMVTCGVLAVAILFYGLFGTGEKQSWAEPRPDTVVLVSKTDPFLEGKPYQGFTTQYTDKKPSPTSTPCNGTPIEDIKHRHVYSGDRLNPFNISESSEEEEESDANEVNKEIEKEAVKNNDNKKD